MYNQKGSFQMLPFFFVGPLFVQLGSLAIGVFAVALPGREDVVQG